MNKKFTFVILATVLFVGVLPISSVYAQEAIYKETKTVSYSGGSKKVNAIYVDLNNRGVKAYTALANNKIGTAASLADIAESKRTSKTKKVVAMNGNFFDAYTGTAQAYGAVVNNGIILHKDYNSSIAAGFDSNKNFYMGSLDFYTDITVIKPNGDKDSIYVIGVNNDFEDANNLFTRNYGDKTPASTVKAIVVENNVITGIVSGQTSIPSNGFVITTDNNSAFQIGDKVEYDYSTGNAFKLGTMFASGPVLVRAGAASKSFEQPGSSPGFTTNKAMRGFIGVTADNHVVMGNVSGVSLPELAEIAVNMGLVNAFNMDGGASSGLYYDGNYVVKPGRNVAVGVVFTLEDVSLNTVTPFYDVEDTAWYTKTLVSLLDKNIISGYKDATFRPNANINVDAFVKMVVCGLGYNDLGIGAGYWASPYIDKAYELGLIRQNEFEYTSPINREQMAVIISRALNETTDKEVSLDLSDWYDVTYRDELSNVFSLGIISGYPDKSIKPQGRATRAEASSMIARMLDNTLRVKK